MLDRCTAIHMASDKDWIERCRVIAQQAGFEESYAYIGVEDIARRVRKTPIQYVFAHYEADEDALRDMVRQVRSHPERDVRYMPLVVFSRVSSASVLKHFLKMGFDDIVTFPCSISSFISRLGQQLNRRLDYIEAGEYFGPDRRRLHMEEDSGRGTGGRFTRIVIQRDPIQGVKVLAQQPGDSRKAG